MKIIKTIFFILVSSQGLEAQNDDPINTDRPDQTEGVYTMSKNQFQLENGITASKGTTLNNLMLYYGMFKGTEARVLVDFGKVDQKNGVLPVMLIVKQRIWDQDKIIPAVSIIGSIGYERIVSKDFSSDKVPVNFLMAFENELSDYFSIGYNLGTTTFNKDLKFSFCLEYFPIDNLSGFLEYFSDFE